MSQVVASESRTFTIRRQCEHCQLAHTFSITHWHETSAVSRTAALDRLNNYFQAFEQSYYTDEDLRDATGAICPHCWKLSSKAKRRFFPQGLKAALKQDLTARLEFNSFGQSVSRVFAAVMLVGAPAAYFLLPWYFVDSSTDENEAHAVQSMAAFLGIGLLLLSLWMFGLSFYLVRQRPKLQEQLQQAANFVERMQDETLLRVVMQELQSLGTFDIRTRGEWYNRISSTRKSNS